MLELGALFVKLAATGKKIRANHLVSTSVAVAQLMLQQSEGKYSLEF